MGGSNTPGAPGTYGTQNTPSTSNVPGARQGAVSWTDRSGNFWLFGGMVVNISTGTQGYLNDLWEFNPTAKTWMWVGGSSTVNTPVGVYGTLGVPSTTNIPGSRMGSVSWTDSSGNLWLFGGGGYGAIGNGALNDLWEFNPTTKQWTWVSGSSTVDAQGIYGTLGTAAPSNVPGGRQNSVSWTDSSGNFWLFGGYGFDSTAGTYGWLNDLWVFNPATKEWTWMGGSSTLPSMFGGQSGVYGTLGVAAAGNVPGGRNASVSWTDSSGNFWLFGGSGFDSTDAGGWLNDLWEFNPTTKEWMWVGGSSVAANAMAVYGTEGTASPNNVPGGRNASVSWTDSSGSFWLFGGCGDNSTGTQGALNDLWEFNPTTKQWTWMSGSSTANATGVYGTMGVAAATNIPEAQSGFASWIDSSGNLWLFGGGGDSGFGNLNDLWRYQP